MDYTNFHSKHFDLQALSEDAYAAIATDGGAAICNAGLIDLGGQILVFDTFLTPRAAKDLSLLSSVKFIHRPQIIINSHFHNDHIWGNQTFLPKAQILSSNRTRNLMLTEGKLEYEWHAAHAAERLESYQTQLQTATEPEQRESINMWGGYYQGLVEAFPALEVKLPSITFDAQLEIHGEKQVARLIEYVGGHTGSDTILYLPQSGIIFMSDLLFVGCHPYLADGDPKQLLKILTEIRQFGAFQFIPGHGPVGTVDDLDLLAEYIQQGIVISQNLVDSGDVSEETISAIKIPDAFNQWKHPQFFQANISFLVKNLTAT